MTYEEHCRTLFGQSVSFEGQILRAYNHDIGEMPGLLMAIIQAEPQAVIVARTREDVISALTLSSRYSVPLTTRSQATSGYGGAIPSNGGTLLDLSCLNRILKIDAEKATVDVEPGVIWEDLSRSLATCGLAVRLCPTSAPASTVGGWFAMGGVGIGSLRYGTFRENVLEIDVAGLDGTITTCSGRDMDPYYQTCGTLGVITRLRLACRTAEALQPVAFALPDAAQAMACLDAVHETCFPWSATLQSAAYCRLHAEADGHAPSTDTGFLLLMSIPQVELRPDALAELAARFGGRLLADEIAEKEWNNRYYPMRIKKSGPSVLVGEFVIPRDAFPTCWDRIRARLPKDELALEAFAVKDGTLAVLVYMLDDASSLLYALRMAKAMIPLRTALRAGGNGYATGMWFAALGRRIHGADKHQMLRRLKTERDPKDLLNSGKTNGPGLRFLPWLNLSRLILFGTALIAPLAARLSYRKRTTCCQ